jgi:MFS family permease
MHDDVAQGAGFRLWFPVAVGAKGLWTMWMSERGRGLVAVISTMAVVTMTFGVTPPLLALVLERQGVSNSLIGMNTAVQALAALLAAPFIPRLMIRFGLGRMMLAALVVTLLALLLLPVYPNVWLWFPLRLLLGIGSGILWICSETWINQLAEEHRGPASCGSAARPGSTSWPKSIDGVASLPFMASPAPSASFWAPWCCRPSAARAGRRFWRWPRWFWLRARRSWPC